MNIETT